MSNVPHGEPYAGKLHVRFDEGAGVPHGASRSTLHPIAGNYSKPDSGSCDGDAARCRERVPDDVRLRVAVGMDRQPEAVPTSSFVTTSRAR